MTKNIGLKLTTLFKMQLIIPMSGIGNRFIQAGYKIPKPLIEVEKKIIIMFAICSRN